jgi:hypothetical protein
LRAERAVLCGIGCCPETGLKATGIPPHLAIAGKVQTLINECKKAHGDAELMQQTMLNDLPAAVARAVGDSLRAEFNIEGVAAVSAHDMRRGFEDMQGVLLRQLQQMQNVGGSEPVATSLPAIQPTWWRTWDWNDGILMHYIPVGWRWPTGITTKQVWDLWYYGNMLQVSMYHHI